MSRKINFRIWSEEEKKFYYTDSNDFINFYEYFEMAPGYSEIEKMRSDKEHTIQQNTGLLDTTGAEIYEGDIVFVEDGGFKYRVCKWRSDVGIWCFRIANDDTSFQTYYNEHKYTIVGNIFENEKLLTGNE